MLCGNFQRIDGRVASPRFSEPARRNPSALRAALAPDNAFGRARAGASCHRARRSRGPARPGMVDEARGFGGATGDDKVPCASFSIAHRRDRVLFAAHLRGSSERRHRGRDDDAHRRARHRRGQGFARRSQPARRTGRDGGSGGRERVRQVHPPPLRVGAPIARRGRAQGGAARGRRVPRADRGERLQAHRRAGGAQPHDARAGGDRRGARGGESHGGRRRKRRVHARGGERRVRGCGRKYRRTEGRGRAHGPRFREGGVGQAVRGAQRRMADAGGAREAPALARRGQPKLGHHRRLPPPGRAHEPPRRAGEGVARRVAQGLLRDGAPRVPRRGSAGQGRGQAGGGARVEAARVQRQLRQVPRGAQAAPGGGREGRVEGGGEGGQARTVRGQEQRARVHRQGGQEQSQAAPGRARKLGGVGGADWRRQGPRRRPGRRQAGHVPPSRSARRREGGAHPGERGRRLRRRPRAAHHGRRSQGEPRRQVAHRRSKRRGQIHPPANARR